ncbi:hypothetical protein M2150_001668 [Lachnospiraceae bacterium PM6-15]|uniref:hypothetical protein n=1 Tax=Ohessyouella blattaphilus TaxID=2949333 RepID=UPI003E275431
MRKAKLIVYLTEPNSNYLQARLKERIPLFPCCMQKFIERENVPEIPGINKITLAISLPSKESSEEGLVYLYRSPDQMALLLRAYVILEENEKMEHFCCAEKLVSNDSEGVLDAIRKNSVKYEVYSKGEKLTEAVYMCADSFFKYVREIKSEYSEADQMIVYSKDKKIEIPLKLFS